MSNQEAKEKHSKRLHDDETHIKKRQRLLRARSPYFSKQIVEEQPHRLHKFTGMNCGNSNCVMCMNPRRAWHEKTMQEQSFAQTERWTEDVLDTDNQG